jgi:uncharacterized membrane protein
MTGTAQGNALSARLARLRARGRLAAAVGVALVAWLAQPEAVSWHTRLVATWDAAALAYLALAWTTLLHADAQSTRAHALAQDASGFVIFIFVLGAACASLVAIGFVMTPMKELAFAARAWHLALTIAALLSSWLLIHTVFAFHYARSYYRRESQHPPQAGGLAFPGGSAPDYTDFAYCSFVVGMTSQVSDVQVVSPTMRRLTLVHGILSFAFNMAVLALSINIIATVL